MSSLLEGAYDLHVHTGPDVNQRKLDDFEMAERYIKAGAKGYCIKSHYFCTAERARLVKKLYPGFHPVGAICLNYSVGGINPVAVDMAARDGAKIVWMPTFDSANEIDFTFGDRCTYKTLPAWAEIMIERKKAGKEVKGINLLETGELTAETKEVLHIVAQTKMVLCTGHLSKAETVAVIREAPRHNLKKIVVTHPTFSSIGFTPAEQKELVEMGAVMEQCYGSVSDSFGIDWPGMYRLIRELGAENCIISSDCGNVNKPFPDVGLLTFIENLLENGFSEDEVSRMVKHNPAGLLED